MRDILSALFPMGSMTGAPKYRAMEIIEQKESFRRELFSGSVGYIAPNGNFDLNVVIRSILYNASSGKIIIPAGSAITAKSDAEKEYEECLLKAKALIQLINSPLAT
jgi:para-aminobenzoate synthetase component 1